MASCRDRTQRKQDRAPVPNVTIRWDTKEWLAPVSIKIFNACTGRSASTGVKDFDGYWRQPFFCIPADSYISKWPLPSLLLDVCFSCTVQFLCTVAKHLLGFCWSSSSSCGPPLMSCGPLLMGSGRLLQAQEGGRGGDPAGHPLDLCLDPEPDGPPQLAGPGRRPQTALRTGNYLPNTHDTCLTGRVHLRCDLFLSLAANQSAQGQCNIGRHWFIPELVVY